MDQIQKCAMCGSIATAYADPQGAVYCKSCGQQGSHWSTSELAIKEWNKQQTLIEHGKQFVKLADYMKKKGMI